MQRLLSKKEVSQILGVHPITIERWVKQGKLKAIKFGETRQSHIVFKEEEIKRFLGE